MIYGQNEDTLFPQDSYPVNRPSIRNDIDELNIRVNNLEQDLVSNVQSINDNINALKDGYNAQFITEELIANTADINTAEVDDLTVTNLLRADNIKVNNIQGDSLQILGADLHGAHLSDSWIVNTALDNVTINNWQVVEPHLDDGVFTNCNIELGNINRTSIIGSNLYGVKIESDAVYNNAHMEDAAFNNSDFTNGRIVDTNIDGGIINGARIERNTVYVTPIINQADISNSTIHDSVIDNLLIDNVKINTQVQPVESSAVLGYDENGTIIPIVAHFSPTLVNNADYIKTDEFGTAFAGTADTVVTEDSSNLVTSGAVYNGILNNNADATLKKTMFGNNAYAYDAFWPYNGKTPTGNLYFTSNFSCISELGDILFDNKTYSTYGTKDGDGYAVGISNYFMAHGELDGVDGVNNIIIMKDQQFSSPNVEINASFNANGYGVPGKNVYIEEWKPGYFYNIYMVNELHTPAGTFEAYSNYVNYAILPSFCGTSRFIADMLIKGDIEFNTEKWEPIMGLFTWVSDNITLNGFALVEGDMASGNGSININNVGGISANIGTANGTEVNVNVNCISSFLEINIFKGTKVHVELNGTPMKRVSFDATEDADENRHFNDHDIYINGFNSLSVDSANFNNNCYFINTSSFQVTNNVNIYLRPSDDFVDTPDMVFYQLFRNLPAGHINIHIPSTFDNTMAFYNWCNSANPVIMLYNDL